MRRLLLLASIWGWSFLFITVAVEGMTPPTVACLGIGLGALTLRAWLRWRRVPHLADPVVRRWAAAVGVVGSVVLDERSETGLRVGGLLSSAASPS